jgi:serine protease Do
MKFGESKKSISPSIIITVIFMAIVLIGNITVWSIIYNKIDNVESDVTEISSSSDLVIDDEMQATIIQQATEAVIPEVTQNATDEVSELLKKDYYLPEDYTSQGLYVAATNLYNVIELTCYGRQKTGANDTSTDYNISSQSTGTIITDDGYVITNAHCVTFDNYEYTVTGTFGPYTQYTTTEYTDIYPSIKGEFTGHDDEYTFTVIDYDETKDLAMLKLDGSVPDIWSKATLSNSDYVQMGEDVIAMGNAEGYGINMTSGIASKDSFYDEDYQEFLIQTDAAINPGNSGGALYNVNAEIIGINSSKIVDSGVEGMGFAIASNSVKDFIDTVATAKGITVSYSYRES